MLTERNLFRAALARMTFLKCHEKVQLLEKLDNIDSLALLSKEELERIFNRRIKAAFWDQSKVKLRAERDLQLLQKYNASFILFGEYTFPKLLMEISQPPFVLYYRGDINILSNLCIGVVGTRHPDADGIKSASSFAKSLGEKGVTVVSGLALGIDAAVHKGALLADNQGQCGKTAAICGCGIDILYPAANRKIASKIIQNGGCILTEYPPEDPVAPWHFPERNRIISGVSAGVMVIEALVKSGALITTDFALEQGRDVYIHPAAVRYAERNREQKDDSFCKPSGVLRYKEEGALVTESADEVISFASRGTIQQSFTF